MNKPLINNRTASEIKQFCTRPTHALIISGENGAGLDTAVEHVISLLRTNHKQIVVTTVEPLEKTAIGIDDVRSLRMSLKHKQSDQQVSRVVILRLVENMQREAQNALLKLLEEPPEGVLFVLTTHDEASVLQTIRSRAIRIYVLPVTIREAREFFTELPLEELERALILCDGLPGKLVKLLSRTEDPEKDYLSQAREILKSSTYDRLRFVEERFKTKSAATGMLSGLQSLCRAAMLQNPAKQNWHHNLTEVLHAQDMIKANVQTKLVLDHLFINIK